jgi:polysaccharide biosynthesis transport protein
MEIQHYARILNHRRLVVLLTTVLTVAVVAFGSHQMTPIYTASGLFRVAQPPSDVVSYSDLSYGQRLIETYVQVLKSQPFLEETRRRLDLPTADLAEIIRIEAIPDTELIRVSVEHPDPQKAAAIVNTLGDLLIEQGQKLYTGEGKDARQILLDQLAAVETQLAEDRANLALSNGATPDAAEAGSLVAKIRVEEETYSMLLSQYEKARVEAVMRENSISAVESAKVPALPSKPNIKLNLALAALVGLMGGVGLAFLFEGLAATIHSADELRALTKVDLVVRIPKSQLIRRLRKGDGPLAMIADTAPEIEAFHALGVSILARHAGAGPQTVMISSAEPEAGKSTIAVNLGAALAQIGQRVIIVDGDQRHPCLHRVFHLPLAPGLVDSALDCSILQRWLHATPFPGLSVLTSGSPRVDTAAFWHSAPLSEAVNQLITQADVVIWDTPPILAAIDPTLLAPLADLVLLVVAEDQTTAKQLNLAIEQLRQVGCEAPGIVYNKTKDSDYRYYAGSKIRPSKTGHGFPVPVRLASVRQKI